MKPLVTCLVLLSLSALPAAARGSDFKRGDSNQDAAIDISDSVYTLGILFLGLPSFNCTDAEDTNDDGSVDISDAVALLNFLFTGGAAPPAPFPGCGPDPTADGNGCNNYAHCVEVPECFDQGSLDEALTVEIDPIVCIPGGGVDPLVVGSFTVTACPADLVSPCPDESGPPGCPVEFTKVSGVLDVPGRTVTMHIEGKVPDLPIVIFDSNFGTSTTCFVDIAFTGDVLIGFTAAAGAGGRLTIQSLLDPSLENEVINVSTKNTEFLCKSIVALQDAFKPQIIEQLKAASDEVLAGIRAELVGKELCP